MMRLAGSLLVAVLAIAGIGHLFSRSAAPVNAAVAISDIGNAYGPADFSEAATQSDDTVAQRRSRLAAAPGEWLRQEALAVALFDRFRLSGRSADLDEAERLLDGALESAPTPSGPTLSSAVVALARHDLDGAETVLDRFGKAASRRTEVDRSEAVAMRGDIAFQRGNLAGAKKRYGEADRLAPSLGTKLRLANTALWSGDAAGAQEIAERAIASDARRPMAFAGSALLMANLAYAQGDIERATEWVDTAGKRYDGFWLIEAYAVQNLAGAGKVDEAIERMETLAKRTGEPEVMDTLTGLLLFRKRADEAARWTARSEAAWQEKLALSRDAYRLHAAEHYLDFGDPQVAVELAREEVAKRPFGEAIEVLASALTTTGNPAEALQWLERAEAAGWRAVSLDLARWEALTELGREDEAKRFLDRARRTNPMAGTDERKLIRFGHF